VSFLSVGMVAQCRFCQWYDGTVISVSRDDGTVSFVSRQGRFLDCLHPTTNCSIYAVASSYHDRLLASCFTLFYASSFTCTNDVPHVSSRWIYAFVDEVVGNFNNYLYCSTCVGTEEHIEIAVHCLAVSRHL
jgi:hypothetical protein